MKNKTIRDRHAALLTLSRRVLPSPTSVHKVSALIATRFARPYESTESARKKLIEDNPAPEDWEGEGLPPFIAEARQSAMNELLELDTPVQKVPERLRLTQADLPKTLKRDGGEENTAMLAEIVVLLGSLYVPSADELALREADADSDGEQEPD